MTSLSVGARALGLATHLDGARLANALPVSGRTPADYGALFDTVSFCLSKGLGAPIGSVLVGNATDIARARTQRKRLGAGWRQAGVLAAAGLHALDHNLDRIVDDHTSAAALAKAVNGVVPGSVEQPETNIVIIPAPDAPGVATELAADGIRISVLGPTTLRAVTHLDVTADQCVEAGTRIGEALARL